MGDLHTILRSLCFNTHWKYAVFWKLKHRARMVLTWEDGYYENCEDLSEIIGNLNGGGGCYSRDPVGLAVAKMSYHVYSLGEGIVGQVAVTGRHQWIFADKYTTNSFSSFEVSDGWQSQFSSGIKLCTIVVIAVAPHGVIQLGSLNKVDEDANLVTHIKEVFLTLQDSSVGHGISPIQYSVKSSLCLPGLPRKDFASEVIPDSLSDLEKVANKGRPNDCSSVFPYFRRQSASSYMSCVSSINQKTSVELTNKGERLELSASRKEGSVKLLQSGSDISYLDHQNQLGMSLVSDRKNPGRVSDCSETLDSNNLVKDTVNLCNPQPTEKFGAGFLPLPTDLSSSTVCDSFKSDGRDVYLNETLNASELSGMKFKNDLQLDCQLESTHFDASNAFLKFSAGCELFEALGPVFLKRCVSFECGKEKADAGDIAEMPERISSTQMTIDTCSENLLEAVVGNVFPSGSDVKSEKSICKSVQSMLTTEKRPELSTQTNHLVTPASFSTNQNTIFEEDTPNCSNSSGVCGGMSSKGFTSTCPSTCSQHLDTQSEPAKNNKKRARPGESCRPRPRDRQLIQDRIKELRDLVPNRSKCSIDSLLERTIKHMVFLESVTKHADKLNKCAESKMHQKGTDTSYYEQGSSWAVEVGSHLKVSSIIVENISKNGQMLVEMLCEECSHFLEIAEAIRGLGLTILKGVTEDHGEKIWICFVVEAQNNRVMHRMDVLWSLVQILQPKTTN